MNVGHFLWKLLNRQLTVWQSEVWGLPKDQTFENENKMLNKPKPQPVCSHYPLDLAPQFWLNRRVLSVGLASLSNDFPSDLGPTWIPICVPLNTVRTLCRWGAQAHGRSSWCRLCPTGCRRHYLASLTTDKQPGLQSAASLRRESNTSPWFLNKLLPDCCQGRSRYISSAIATSSEHPRCGKRRRKSFMSKWLQAASQSPQNLVSAINPDCNFSKLFPSFGCQLPCT